MVPAATLGDASSIDDTAMRIGHYDQEAGDDDVATPDDAIDEGEAAVDDGAGATDTDAAEDSQATVVQFPTPADQAVGADEIDDDDVTATDVDDLFARLRASEPPADDTADEADEADEAVEESRFRRRDAALVPLIVASARKLKRVLADEQNEVLDALRRKEPVRNLDVLVPWQSEQADRYADAIGAELLAAAMAGADSVGSAAQVDAGPSGPIAPVREQLAADVIAPLRERLERSVAEGEGDNDAVAKRARGVYREWKTQRIDEQLDDLFRLAYCQGAMSALGAGARVTWEVDPDGPPSPDCEDNALGGPVTIGDAFPSGHVTPPMHPGCRCLLVPVEG